MNRNAPAHEHRGQPAAAPAVPWSLLDCAAAVGLTAVLVVVVVNLVALVGGPMDAAPDGIFLALPLLVLAVVTAAWVQLRHGAAGALTGPARAGVTTWLVGAGLGIAGFVAVNVLLSVLVQAGAAVFDFDLPEPQPGLRDAAADPQMVPWLVLSAVVVAPVAEEVFFRGMLLQALRRRMGAWAAILLSAVLFAVAHLLAEPTPMGGALAFVMILPLGLFLGWMFERWRSIATPIAAHALFNAVTLALMLWAVGEGVMAVPGG